MADQIDCQDAAAHKCQSGGDGAARQQGKAADAVAAGAAAADAGAESNQKTACDNQWQRIVLSQGQRCGCGPLPDSRAQH